MKIEDWIFGSVITLLLLVWVWDKYVTPRRMTRPPVDRIMGLISEGKLLVVHDNPSDADHEECNHLLDYVIRDTKRGVKTYLYRNAFNDSAIVSGDLEWMNQWEQKRVLSLVEGICAARKKAYKKACDIAKFASDQRRREEAENIY